MKDMIEAIVFLPDRFYDLGDKSMQTLLKETGYLETFNEVTEDRIYTALKENPYVMDKWMTWSQNKRSASGWYFLKEGKTYIVDFLPARKGTDKFESLDQMEACATFIKREIEEIRKNLKVG